MPVSHLRRLVRRLMAIAVVASVFVVIDVRPSLAAINAPPTPPATQSAGDVDFNAVRDAIVKSMPKVKPEDVAASKTIGDLGGRDINFMEVIGALQENADLSIDDAAVEKVVNANASKKMSDVTVAQLAALVKASRQAK